MKSFLVHVYLVLLYLHVSLSLLKRCSASLVYRKCSKKTIAEGAASLMSLLFSNSMRTGLRVVTMIVFVNQLLLMRAGDVERNPGPGKGGGNLCHYTNFTCVHNIHVQCTCTYTLGIGVFGSFITPALPITAGYEWRFYCPWGDRYL